MKKLITTLALAVISVAAFAQSGEKLGIRPYNWTPKSQTVRTQSLDVNATTSSVSVLYLRDGLDTSYTAVAYPVFQVTGLQNRVSVVALGSFANTGSKTQVYAGTGLGLQLFQSQGFSGTLYGGLKGLDASHNFSFASGKEAWVVGVGLTIPIR